MHDAVFQIVLTWQTVLIAALAVRGARSRSIVGRAIALDTLALVFVAALASIAVARGRPDYLDVALVLAMLGFTQTIATARFVAPDEEGA